MDGKTTSFHTLVYRAFKKSSPVCPKTRKFTAKRATPHPTCGHTHGFFSFLPQISRKNKEKGKKRFSETLTETHKHAPPHSDRRRRCGSSLFFFLYIFFSWGKHTHHGETMITPVGLIRPSHNCSDRSKNMRSGRMEKADRTYTRRGAERVGRVPPTPRKQKKKRFFFFSRREKERNSIQQVTGRWKHTDVSSPFLLQSAPYWTYLRSAARRKHGTHTHTKRRLQCNTLSRIQSRVRRRRGW